MHHLYQAADLTLRSPELMLVCLQPKFPEWAGPDFFFLSEAFQRASLRAAMSRQPFQQVSPAGEVWCPAVLTPRGPETSSQPAAEN